MTDTRAVFRMPRGTVACDGASSGQHIEVGTQVNVATEATEADQSEMRRLVRRESFRVV